MLVCPNCRSENQEEAEACAQCGRSLRPEEAALLRRSRREPEEMDIEIPARPRPSPVTGILALLTTAVLAGGIASWWMLRPDPCEGKFSSPRFSYCVEIPLGWQDSEEQIQGAVADAFAPPTFDPVVLVIAEQAQPGMSSQDYAARQRQAQEADGLFPGPTRPVDIGGSPAVAWDLTTTAEDGSRVRQRQVAVVRSGQGWIIAYVGAGGSFEDGITEFQHMLESWSWK